MMKRILCLLTAVMLCLILPAAAEENTKVVTAAELDELLERVRAQALTEELLNDPTGEDAESEDGTFFLYEAAGFYAEGTEMTADNPVNTLVFDCDEENVLRGTGMNSRVEDVLAAFPLDNADLAGTREDAILYLRETEAGFAYGRILRDGQWINTVEYGEVVSDGEMSCRTAVTYSLENGTVNAIRVSGLNPAGGELMDASQAEEFYNELIQLAGCEDYEAVKTSRNGLELTVLDAEELIVGGLPYVTMKPGDLPGTPETEIIDNEDGTWLLRCDGDGYEAVFRCGEHGEDAEILSFTILDDGIEGPRSVRIGDIFSDDFNRFRNGENEMGEDMTELLYGTEGTAPYGVAFYDFSAMTLRYVTDTPEGLQVELLLKYDNYFLTEIILHTV
ncbi:hypothetical protein [Aristaeella hokkaidonensis]|uniref:Uncharacterized protein n=1 Tax=Aristaeella hokkaidonensis TaxID=3046382 RepID=A0AC61MVN7_9FIRM|nr:hypothetical protein [Aristaeella hokkaidonensis]QUC66655.1 hypothetical protein JYE49_12485 [Aristaeella hokkaidonensis]SNT94628.1 hypothetical protein SAMN06297421_10639 [Aristaeella hokkaidonensis]